MNLSEDHDWTAIFSKLLDGFVETEKFIHLKAKTQSGHGYRLQYFNFKKYDFKVPGILI